MTTTTETICNQCGLRGVFLYPSSRGGAFCKSCTVARAAALNGSDIMAYDAGAERLIRDIQDLPYGIQQDDVQGGDSPFTVALLVLALVAFGAGLAATAFGVIR